MPESAVREFSRIVLLSCRPALIAALTLLAVVPAVSAGAALAPLEPVFGTDPIDDPDRAGAYRALEERTLDALDAERWREAAAGYEELVVQFPGDASSWNRLGWACYQLEDFARAEEAFARAVELGMTFPDFARYNRACCLARMGDVEGSVQALEETLAGGFENRPSIVEDPDLRALHDHPRWAELAGLLPEDVSGRDEGWRHDLAFLVDEIRRLHPDPFRVTPEEEFEARVARLDSRIPELSDEQVAMELHKITALLGDGHSGVRPVPGSRIQPRALPLQLYAFADGLFVIDAAAPHEELIGAEVLGIGSKGLEALWADLPALVPSDSRIRVLQQGPFVLTLTAALRNLGAIGETEEVPLRLRRRDGTESTVVVDSEPLRRPQFELIASRLPGAPGPPSYLAREHEVAWFDEIDAGETVFAQVNVIRDGPEESLAEFADRLSGHLQATPAVRNLIVDLRHNGGGNSFLYPPLVRALVAFEQTREDARIFVLMGRQSFSACQNLLTDLDWWTGAVLVGEPSGSSPNAIGESTWSRLPFSGLRAGISSRYHQQSYPGDERGWLSPDVPVALGSADYFANRDPVLDAVRALIEEGQAGR